MNKKREKAAESSKEKRKKRAKVLENPPPPSNTENKHKEADKEVIMRACKEKVQEKDVEKALEILLDIYNKNKVSDTLAYLLASNEQTVISASKEEAEKIIQMHSSLKDKALKDSAPEWREALESISIKIVEQKKESNTLTKAALIECVIEALIATSAAEIEKAVDLFLGTQRADPRLPETQNLHSEVIREALKILTQIPAERAKDAYIIPVVKMLDVSHAPILIEYLSNTTGSVSAPSNTSAGDTATETANISAFLLAVFVHNKRLYSELEKEIKNLSPSAISSFIGLFPKIDIDTLLDGLSVSPKMLTPLQEVFRRRPIHRKRISDYIITHYLKKGSRTRCLGFIRDNLEYLTDRIEEMALSCEEILLLAEKMPNLLSNAFIQISEISQEVKERVGNYQRKEKRASSLLSGLVNQLAQLDTPGVTEFFLSVRGGDGEILGRVSRALFRSNPPNEEIQKILIKILPESNSGFALSLLPFLDISYRIYLLPIYLRDDLSMSLFLRVIPPEEILVQALSMAAERGKEVLSLCMQRPDAFTDRSISVALTKVEKESPKLLSWVLKWSLETFPNMRPFVVALIKRSWKTLISSEKDEFISVLEALGEAASEVLLGLPEEAQRDVLLHSQQLRQEMDRNISTHPEYVRQKYKDILSAKKDD